MWNPFRRNKKTTHSFSGFQNTEMGKVHFDKENGVWYRFFIHGQYNNEPMMAVSISDSEDFMGHVFDSSFRFDSYNVAVKNLKCLKESSIFKNEKLFNDIEAKGLLELENKTDK